MKKQIFLLLLVSFIFITACRKDTTPAAVVTDVYAAGYEFYGPNNYNSIAKYWKNGTEVNY